MFSLSILRCAKHIKNRSFQTSSVVRKFFVNSGSLKAIKATVRLCTLKSNYTVLGTCKHNYSTASVNDENENVEEEIKTKKGRIFTQRENDFNHSVLERNPAYSRTILKLDEEEFKKKYDTNEEEFNNIISRLEWGNVTPDETFKSFIKAGVFVSRHLKIPLSDSRFKHLSDGFVSKCKHLTDDQLIESLISLSVWPQSESVLEENFLNVWKALDAQLLEKYTSWDIEKKLYVIDVWYNLKLTRLSEFVFLVTMRLSRKVLKFTPSQLIQILFYMNTARKISPVTSMFEFEYMLEQHVDKLSIEELGVAATGFFKSKNRIKNVSLLVNMIGRVINNIDNIPDITLSSLIKVIRYSPKAAIATKVEELMDILATRMDLYGFLTNIHILLLANSLNIFHEQAITKVVEQFLQQPSEVRLKDIEKISQTLSMYNFIPSSSPDVLSVIVKELQSPERENERINHSRCIASILYHLSLMKVYPLDLIKGVLKPEWIYETYGKQKFTVDRYIPMLHYNVHLECSEKNLSMIPAAALEYYCKRHSKFIPGEAYGKMSPYDTFVNELIINTEKILGRKDRYLCNYLLPHFGKADIAFYLDDNNRPLPIPANMRNIPYFERVIKPTKPGNWRCLFAAARNMYIINRRKLVGEFCVKLRQLELLGYEPIVISMFDWYELTDEQKESFLRHKMFTRSNSEEKVRLEEVT